jgi:hypothetical protein
VLVGLAVVLGDGIDPRLQTLSPDLLDNGRAGLVYDCLIERNSDACRGKLILQRSAQFRCAVFLPRSNLPPTCKNKPYN